MEKSKAILPFILVILLFLCCCVIVLAAGAYYLLTQMGDIFNDIQTPIAVSSPVPSEVYRPPVDTVSDETLRVLEQTTVPVNDLADLACRLQSVCDVPRTLEPPASPLQVGARQTFWATDVMTNSNFAVDAVLRYITPHAYFWVEDGVSVNEREMADLMQAFENQMYPTNRDFFGSEWTPGVDGDPHIYIMYVRGIGYSIAGYFSAADEYHPLAHEYSNAHEMFFFNADNTPLDEEFTYSVLAHEFQHMIHWYQDRNETSWLNEGFSELAAFLNGYDIGGFDWLYTSNPDLQLNDWPNDQNATSPHYGAGFLFVTYFLDRFGDEATQALVHDPQNGLESVDNVLSQIGATDGLTGQDITADDFALDWMIANYLGAPNVADGRYTYHNYSQFPRTNAATTISTCPRSGMTFSVHQYGADYIAIDCQGSYSLHFEGSTATTLLPEGPYSGSYAFWSNKGDESNMTLTRSFDLSGVSGPVTFSYWTWYDLETDYDYLYLEVSTDGEHWEIITTPSGTDEDPSGNSFGWGYNGVSQGWIQESIDLSRFAGQNISLRFEYVTDAAVNGEGLLLDDISIPETGYFSDFETDDGGWEAAGFVRVQNILPQTFRLALILRGSAGTTVQIIPVNPDQTAEIPLVLGEDYNEAVLVLTGTTRFTRQVATYQLSVR